MGYEMLARYGMWAVLILSVVGAVWWGAATIHDNIYEDGRRAERVIWQDAEVKKSAERNARIVQLNAKLTALEQEHNKKMSVIETQHLKEIEDANKQKAADIAAVRAGTVKLRYAGNNSGRGSSGGTATAPVGASSVCNDKTGGELPAEVTANLYAIVDDADRNTKQLRSCQEVILADRATLNPPTINKGTE